MLIEPFAIRQKSPALSEENKALFLGENAKRFYRFADLLIPTPIKNMMEDGCMRILHATDYGIYPGGQIAGPLAALCRKLQTIPGEKTLLFAPGTYHIDRDDCEDAYYAITNTAGKAEYSDPARVQVHRIGLHLQHVENLTIDGQGAAFLLDGKLTNCVVSKCKNITLQNLTLDTLQPNVHKLTVEKVTPFTIHFRLDAESKYEQDGGSFAWVGKGYRLGFLENAHCAFWTASIRSSQPHRLFRTAHPFFGVKRIEETAPYHFKASYLLRNPMQPGQTFYVYDAMRDEVGIFLNCSESVQLENVAQHFNYSLGIVAQDCVNLTFHKLHMAPKENASRKLTSLADFMQLCMCAGDVRVTDCYFDGAADDMLNVHGVHFKITQMQGRCITVKFCHPQTWGFNPLHAGDQIELIDPQTLLPAGSSTIQSSDLLDEYHIRLELATDADAFEVGAVIEDIDRCPQVYFARNTLDRIITRGLLLTTRGKTVVEHNHFVNTSMSGILHSDDANSWYESGPVRDVTIQNNRFDFCGQTPILIKPENRRHAGAVHRNIRILHNTFGTYQGPAMRIKSTDTVTIRGNQLRGTGKQIQTQHTSNLQSDL